MPNMTLAIPSDLHDFVKAHQEINWSEVARQAMRKQAKKMQLLDSLMSESMLDEHEIDTLDHLLKSSISKKLKQ